MLAMNKTYPRCPVGRLSPQGVSRQAPHKPTFTGTGADAEDVGLRCVKPTYKAAAPRRVRAAVDRACGGRGAAVSAAVSAGRARPGLGGARPFC